MSCCSPANAAPSALPNVAASNKCCPIKSPLLAVASYLPSPDEAALVEASPINIQISILLKSLQWEHRRTIGVIINKIRESPFLAYLVWLQSKEPSDSVGVQSKSGAEASALTHRQPYCQ